MEVNGLHDIKGFPTMTGQENLWVCVGEQGGEVRSGASESVFAMCSK